jgi:hypothetical protein
MRRSGGVGAAAVVTLLIGAFAALGATLCAALGLGFESLAF